MSGFKEKSDFQKKGQHISKKSEAGNSKIVKENPPIKGASYFLSVQKKSLLKPKGVLDNSIKEQPSIMACKKPHATVDLREKSKDSTRSKDFGRLLKKVTNSL